MYAGQQVRCDKGWFRVPFWSGIAEVIDDTAGRRHKVAKPVVSIGMLYFQVPLLFSQDSTHKKVRQAAHRRLFIVATTQKCSLFKL